MIRKELEGSDHIRLNECPKLQEKLSTDTQQNLDTDLNKSERIEELECSRTIKLCSPCEFEIINKIKNYRMLALLIFVGNVMLIVCWFLIATPVDIPWLEGVLFVAQAATLYVAMWHFSYTFYLPCKLYKRIQCSAT